MNRLNLTIILSTSKLTNEHFTIKNEIDPQFFATRVHKESVFNAYFT